MIYITGDTHGPKSIGFNSVDGVLHRFNSNNFPEQKNMTKNDYVIILGDFGCIWNVDNESSSEKNVLDWLDDKSFTTLFIDGNHENFDRLYNYPEKQWHNGKVHEIRNSVLHLMRGYVFNIDNKNIFAFGGASSHDIKDGILHPKNDLKLIKRWKHDYTKQFRILNYTYWELELPTKYEMDRGINSLKCNDFDVDFILSHSPSSSTIDILGNNNYKHDILTDYLENIKNTTKYKYWFCGHMHINKKISDKEIILYEQIIKIN